MLTARLHHRGFDDWGAGHFGAPRGSRKHTGVDYACLPGAEIVAPVNGEITKLGYAYADDLSYRYVQITDEAGRQHRVFYVKPALEVGRLVRAGQTVIGTAQDIASRYKDPEKKKGPMINHVHYEVKQGRRYLNPEELTA